MAKINVHTDELLPAREASRALGKAIDRLVSGAAEKYVIVNRNKVQAVLLSVDRYAELANGEQARSETRRAA
jgi:PHD/YefM family antitoxin component YafN of YafNO toxin-antitoxin module